MAKRTRKRRPKRSSRTLPGRDQRLREQLGEQALEPPDGADTSRGTVVTLLSGACQVERDGRRFKCVLPSRLALDQRSTVAVGDEVDFAPHGKSHRLLAVHPRRTVLSRPHPHNPRLERVVAANVDVVVQVASVAEPPLRVALVDRYLIAIERGGAEPCLCVNKIDLLSEHDLAAELDQLAGYREMGLEILPCSAKTGAGVEALRRFLAGRTAVFVGHSGVGKSSLLKALDPEVDVATGEVSRRYARGRHTTTRSQLYRLGGNIRLIDTPGIRELGLWKMSAEELRFFFPDFEETAAACKFNDCTHSHEPECGVREAAREGRLSPQRYATYLRILESLAEDDS